MDEDQFSPPETPNANDIVKVISLEPNDAIDDDDSINENGEG